ncbi:hypothetical protein GGQ05_000805 [Salinibacter ruber]|nr:hypothetical protein [Salinibacter ruber]
MGDGPSKFYLYGSPSRKDPSLLSAFILAFPDDT